MRAALRIAAALLLLVVLLVALAARMVDSEALRGAVAEVVVDALGSSFRYESFRIGLIPPSLIFLGPEIAGEGEDAPAFVAARNASLQVAVLPLFIGAVVVDRLVIDGPVLKIDRTHDGVVLLDTLPWASPSDEPEILPAPDGASSPARVVVLAVEVRDGTIVFSDRTTTPAVEGTLRGVNGRVDLKPAEESIEFEFTLEVASGGRVAARGQVNFDAHFDAVATIDEFALEPLTPYLAATAEPESGEPIDSTQLSGIASGSVALRGPIASPDLAIDVEVREGTLELDEWGLAGRMQIEATLSGPLDRSEGRFDIDATDAEVRYIEIFAKASGARASVTGRIVSRDGIRRLDDIRLKIANLDAHGSLGFGERTKVTLEVEPFDLEGWGVHIPALEEYKPTGQVRIGHVEMATAPLDLRGVIGLDGVTVSPFSGPPALLHGELVAEGDVLRTHSLSVETVGQRLEVDSIFSGLGSEPRHRLRVGADGVDTNALVSAYADVEDAVYGTLDLRVDVSEKLSAGVPMLQALEGNMDFQIENGRLVGVSLLELALGSMSPLLGAFRFARLAIGDEDSGRFDGDEFDSISGTLNINRGVVSTENFRMIYQDYAVDLWGTLQLEGLELDMKGNLSMGSEIASLLGSGSSSGGNEIPLASVRGTLDAPQVVVTPDAVNKLIAKFRISVAEEALEKLGTREGKAALSVLDEVLGSQRPTAD